MANRGLIAGSVIALGAMLVASTRKSKAQDDGVEVHYTIERLVPAGWGYERYPDSKKRGDKWFDEPRWLAIPGLYCFGKDGSGGECRVGNDLKSIEALSGHGFSAIDTEEEGLTVIALLERNIPGKLRLVRNEVHRAIIG